MAKNTAIARMTRRETRDWGSEALVCLWAWLVMAGCFVGLAMHAASGHVARTDLRLLKASQQMPDTIQPLVTMQRSIGSPETLALCTVLLALVLFVRFAWLEGLVVLSALGVFAVTVIIKHLVAEVPPYQLQPAEYNGILESNYSFPSGHVVGLAVLSGLVFIFADRLAGHAALRFLLRVAAFIFAAAVGPGRIYLNVHYPSDVVAAYLLAALFLLPVWFLYTMLRHKSRSSPAARR